MTSRSVSPRLTAALTLALYVLPACSSGDDSTQLLELSVAPALGRVSLAIVQGGVALSSVGYRVLDATGTELLRDELDVSGPGSTLSFDFELPAGSGYAIELGGETEGGLRCTGSQTFDVVAGETRDVSVELRCSAPSGTTRVTGTLIEEDPTCPQLDLIAPTAPIGVGETIALRASSTGSETPSYVWSASAGQVQGANDAEAAFTCTAPGAVTLTLAIEGCEGSASVEVECAAASSDACAGLGSSCHVVDPGSGPLHECHELGHAGDAAACGVERASCVQACGDALCQTLGSLCHEVDPGSGPLHECHELGHSGDAAACFERGRECFDLCTAAQQAASSVPVTLRFAAKVGEADFACGTAYDGVGLTGARVEPQDFRFYVEGVRLVTTTGEEVPVMLDERPPWQTASVALLDFEDAQGACFNGDVATNVEVTGRVPAGEYSGVVFVNSVPEALSHADPATLPAPLQVGSMSWGWLLGFRFVRAELLQVPDEVGAVPGLGLLHLGSTACTGSPQLGTVTCARRNRNEVRLNDFDPATSRIVADIGALFADADLTLDSQCHSSGDACAPLFESLGVDLDTGDALATQRVFRVEAGN